MAPEQQRRVRTVDRGPPGPGVGPPLSGVETEPLSVGQIGPNRQLLPDGSLLCRNVPIARTGWLQYAPGEVPLEPSDQPGAAPVLYVHRAPEDVFAEEAMRSFIGCAITHEHPPVAVTPANFAHLGKGFILRVWRGEGPDADCLMADLIIKDKWLIEQIERNKREVSCGYEASYIQTSPGQGKQVNIVGNHLALVEKGRCGPRCAIGDEDTLSSTVINEDTDMTTPQAGKGASRPRIPLTEARQRVVDAMADLEAAETGGDGKAVHVHVHMGQTADAAPPAEGDGTTTPPTAATPTVDKAVEERFVKLEGGLDEVKGLLKDIAAGIAPKAPAAAATTDADPEVVTEATATMDSAALQTGYQQFMSQAEILVPGFKLPTFDASMQRKLTVDRMCQGRRMVLGALQATADGSALLTTVNGGKEFDVLGATCPDVALAFKAAAAKKAEANNRSATGDSSRIASATNEPPAKRWDPAAVNAANKDFWSKQGPRA